MTETQRLVDGLKYVGYLGAILLLCLGISVAVRHSVFRSTDPAICLRYTDRQGCLDDCGCGWCLLPRPHGTLPRCLPSNEGFHCQNLNGTWDYEITSECDSQYAHADTAVDAFGYVLIPISVILLGMASRLAYLEYGPSTP